MEGFEGYKILLKERLSEKRYTHSINVADMAAKLAMLHGVDIEKAYLAGLMHDYAKNLSDEELLTIGEKNALINNEIEILAPYLLHGPVGAYLLKQEEIITDEAILQAISLHTTGQKGMNRLDMVIYMADYLEVGRNYPNVEGLRAVSYKSLDYGMIGCLDNTIHYLMELGALIHPFSIEARNYMIAKLENRN